MTASAALVVANAVCHVVAVGVEGAIVESRVWRGGSMMTVARTLMAEGRDDVDLYLLDTFDQAMPAPSARDVHWRGQSAGSPRPRPRRRRVETVGTAGLDEVQRAMALTGYPPPGCTASRGAPRTRCPSTRPTESRRCGSTPSGTSRPGTS